MASYCDKLRYIVSHDVRNSKVKSPQNSENAFNCVFYSDPLIAQRRWPILLLLLALVIGGCWVTEHALMVSL